VGCDWVIQSDAREDKCGVCHGDGTTCQTIKQSFDKESGLGMCCKCTNKYLFYNRIPV